MSRKSFFKIIVLAVAFSFNLSTFSIAAPISMRMSVHQSSTDWLTLPMHEGYKSEIEKATGGRINVKTYYGGSLHKGAEGFDALRTDITDFTPAYPLWKAGAFHLAHLISLPFAFKNNLAACLAVGELYNKYFKGEFEALGVIPGVNWIMTNSVLLTKRPVRNLEDLRGMKIAASGPMSDHIKALGGVPTNIATPEIYNALERGIVDGVYYSPSSMVQWHYIEVAKYYTDFPMGGGYLSYCMNPKWYNALPKDLQTIVYNVNRKAEMSLWNRIIKSKDNEIYGKLKEFNGEVIKLSPAEKERWVAKTSPLWDEFVKKNEAEHRPARQLVNEWKAALDKYEKMTDEQLLDMANKQPFQGISMTIGK